MVLYRIYLHLLGMHLALQYFQTNVVIHCRGEQPALSAERQRSCGLVRSNRVPARDKEGSVTGWQYTFECNWDITREGTAIGSYSRDVGWEKRKQISLRGEEFPMAYVSSWLFQEQINEDSWRASFKESYICWKVVAYVIFLFEAQVRSFSCFNCLCFHQMRLPIWKWKVLWLKEQVKVVLSWAPLQDTCTSRFRLPWSLCPWCATSMLKSSWMLCSQERILARCT